MLLIFGKNTNIILHNNKQNRELKALNKNKQDKSFLAVFCSTRHLLDG
jgi:hypothetical protein